MRFGHRVRRGARRGASLAVAVALLVPAPASADIVTGYVGGSEVEGFCGDRGTMGRARMDITSSVATTPAGVTISGSQRLQWFSWLATLYYSADGVNWSVSGTSSWRAGQVGDPINSVISNANFYYDYATGTYGTGWPIWTLPAKGTYGIWMNMWWWADSMSPGGHVEKWALVTNGVTSGYSCLAT